VESPDGVAVTAIHYETTKRRRETLSADLVVDASARGLGTSLVTAEMAEA
jgi:hypothetical protein